jgi:hypothetical protein
VPTHGVTVDLANGTATNQWGGSDSICSSPVSV